MGEEAFVKSAVAESSVSFSNEISHDAPSHFLDNKNKNEAPLKISSKKPSDGKLLKKGLGSRQRRRLENTNFLLSLVENEEYSHEETFSEFVTSGTSCFEKLFIDKESMEIWNDFMNKTGEEQDQYLEGLAEGEEVRGTVAKVEREQREKENTLKEEEGFVIIDEKDKRKAFPAYTPEECYLRINSRLRGFLRRRHIPKDALEYREEELVTWFSDDPHSVWISHLPNNYERLVLHAVSQYLNLYSASYNCKGVRHTKVENKNDFFYPPLVCLSDYLQSVS